MVRNMVKNRCLAKSISDAAWRQFFEWLEYYGQVFGKIVIAVPPQYTSQECSSCHRIVKKSLSERTHACMCGCVLDRDENARRNLLAKGLEYLSRGGTLTRVDFLHLMVWDEGVTRRLGDRESFLATFSIFGDNYSLFLY